MTQKPHGPTGSDDSQTMRITSLPMSQKLCAHVLLHPVSARERVRRIPPDSLQSQDTCFRLLAHHPKTSGWSKPAFVPAQQRRHFCGDASSSFKPRAPRHIYCVWAPLGLITTGGMKGWMAGKRTPYPRDPLVYKEHEQSVSHQKNK